jgi:hypothetical protein
VIRLEASSLSRDPARAEANEDAFVVLPGRAYAVIDGVSDRTGTRYDGELSGRHAARLVAATLERLLLGAAPPVESIVPTLTAALHEAYLRHGTLDAAQESWGNRLCCTLALALHDGPHLHLVLVGDSGIRLNGRQVLQMDKDLDYITSTLRSHTWRRVADPDPAVRDRVARQASWKGLNQDADVFAPELSAEDLAAIGAAAEAELAAALPHVPRADILHLLRNGIVGAQGDYQNTTDSVLGYACLDGFTVPRSLMQVSTIAARGVETLELFTDGYFDVGAEASLASWEARHAEVEKEDPAKVGKFRSAKGSVPGRWSDDRTYVGVVYKQAVLF